MTELNQARYVPFILKAAALGAMLGTLAPALTIAVLTGLRNGSLLHPLDAAETVLLLFPITVVSCGPFGLLAAVTGGSAIYLRRKHIRTSKRLLTEAAVAGFLLGCLFLFFDAAENSLLLKEPFQPLVIPEQILFYPVLGVLCALICALVLRSSFVQRIRLSNETQRSPRCQ